MVSPRRDSGHVGVQCITVPRRGSVVLMFPIRVSRLVSLTRTQNRPLGTSIASLFLAVNTWPQTMCLVHEPKHCGMFGPLVKTWLTCLSADRVDLTVCLMLLENSTLCVPRCLLLRDRVSLNEKLGALLLLTSVSAIRGVNLANLGLDTEPTTLTVRPVPVIDLSLLSRVR